MFSSVVVVIVVLVFLYFILNPDKVPAFLRRDQKQKKESENDSESESDDDSCSVKVKRLLKQRDELIKELNAYCE